MIRLPGDQGEQFDNSGQVLQSLAPHPYQSLNADGDIVAVNDAWLRELGYERAEVVGRWFGEFLAEPSREKFRSRFEAFTSNGEISDVEFEVENGDGELRDVTFDGIAEYDEDGEFVRTHCQFTDVTDREERKRDLETLTRQYESLTQHSSDIITIIDSAGTITTQHPAVERIIGIESQPEREGSPVFEYVHPTDRERVTEAFERFVASDEKASPRIEFRYEDPDGSSRWLESNVVDLTDTVIGGYVVYSSDITARKERNRELKRYKSAVEGSKDLLAAVDDKLQYLFANETYRQYHGIEGGDVTGRSLPAVLGPEAFEAIEPKVRAAQRGETVVTEVTRTHPTEGERILDVLLFPLEGTVEEVQGVGASMRDITEDREREAAIRHEAELRRLLSEVTQTLVRGTDVESVLQRVVEIIADSAEFTCTFLEVTDTLDLRVVCEEPSDVVGTGIEGPHRSAYVDRVLEDGLLHVTDVTEAPFDHHSEETASHHGIGVAVTYGETEYGVLTVHFPPGTEPTEEDCQVLETIADDLGYFIAHQELRSEAKTFAEIVGHIHDPVMLQNRDGTFRVINDAVGGFAGLEKEALIGAEESAFMNEAAADRIAEMKDRVLETESPVTYRVEPTFPDGRERTFSTTRHPYYDKEGRLDGTLAICRDVTDLEEHQHQLRMMDRVLRHNVNNNMTVVQGFARLIRREASGRTEEHATRIVENSQQLLDIADKQRKITTFLGDPDPIQRIELPPLIDHVVDRVRAAHPSARITVEQPESLAVVAIAAIEDALEELLTNSIVHAAADVPDPTLRVVDGEGVVEVQVLDDNEPIAPMDRQVLVGGDELDTLRHGSGLGLGLVRLIVDHFDGELRFDTRDQVGNVVTIGMRKP